MQMHCAKAEHNVASRPSVLKVKAVLGAQLQLMLSLPTKKTKVAHLGAYAKS